MNRIVSAMLLAMCLMLFTGRVAAQSVECERDKKFEDCGGDDGDDGGRGGGDGPDCPTESADRRLYFSCWTMNSGAMCPEIELGIGRRIFERDVEDSDGDGDTDEWVGNHMVSECVGSDDVGLDPWEVWAGVDVTSGGIGSELAGTEEVPIWTGYENGFWLEGDTEAYDSDSSVDTAYTGFDATVEVRAWPSEVSIDTGDDGPISGDSETSSYTLETDEFGQVVTGSEEDPLFTHMFETKGTDVGHECACFLAEVDAVWSGEYRWGMGGMTTGWQDFDYEVEAEPTMIALQVWEVVSRLR